MASTKIQKGIVATLGAVAISKADYTGKREYKLSPLNTERNKELLNTANVTGVAVIVLNAPYPKEKTQPATPQIDASLEQEFKILVQEWRVQTMFKSNPKDITGHLLYYQIVSLGKAIVPFILRDLQKGGGYWFLALRALTKRNPVKAEHLGNRKKMTEDWLEWGKEHGYIDG